MALFELSHARKADRAQTIEEAAFDGPIADGGRVDLAREHAPIRDDEKARAERPSRLRLSVFKAARERWEGPNERWASGFRFERAAELESLDARRALRLNRALERSESE